MNDDEDLPRSSIAPTGLPRRGRIDWGRMTSRQRVQWIAGLA